MDRTVDSLSGQESLKALHLIGLEDKVARQRICCRWVDDTELIALTQSRSQQNRISLPCPANQIYVEAMQQRETFLADSSGFRSGLRRAFRPLKECAVSLLVVAGGQNVGLGEHGHLAENPAP